MLPSYTKPNMQSVQPGAAQQPATATGYAVGANPITASRGAVADMTKAPAMPANPQVQSQPGIPQAWQSPYYMQNLRSYYNARPDMAGLGSLPPQAQHMYATPQSVNDPAANAELPSNWRNSVQSFKYRENTPSMYAAAPAYSSSANQAVLQAKEQNFWKNAKANYDQMVAAPQRAQDAAAAKKARPASYRGRPKKRQPGEQG